MSNRYMVKIIETGEIDYISCSETIINIIKDKIEVIKKIDQQNDIDFVREGMSGINKMISKLSQINKKESINIEKLSKNININDIEEIFEIDL